MSEESLELPAKASVSISLVPISSTRTSNHRVLFERQVLKLGRQVKAMEEKMAAAISDADPGDDPISVPGIGTLAKAFFKASVAAVTAGQPESSKPTESQAIEPVWCKSKVVSRIHAEIWLKDGHVR
jgi:hypothetical protein